MRRSILLAIAGAVLYGCASAPTAAATSAPPRTAYPSPPAQTAAPSPPPTPASPACLEQQGTFTPGEYIDADLPRSIPYRVYLPPCFREPPAGPYPVLLMLHGLLATDQQWQDLGIGEVADRLIAQGDAPPFLILLPWERKGLEFESALADHLLPDVQETYSGAKDRGHVAVGGLSRGAGWALRLGLKHPSLFGAIGLHSPAVLTPDLYYLPEWVKAIPEADRPRLWIDVGDHDSLRSSVFELTAALDGLGFPYTWTFDPGDHTPEYWSGHLEAYLRWYTESW